MATTVTRTPAYFRFQSTLMDELKSKAKASNRSLNNYVESLLKAISEVREGKSYAMKQGESFDAFMDRMEKEGNV